MRNRRKRRRLSRRRLSEGLDSRQIGNLIRQSVDAFRAEYPELSLSLYDRRSDEIQEIMVNGVLSQFIKNETRVDFDGELTYRAVDDNIELSVRMLVDGSDTGMRLINIYNPHIDEWYGFNWINR